MRVQTQQQEMGSSSQVKLPATYRVISSIEASYKPNWNLYHISRTPAKADDFSFRQWKKDGSILSVWTAIKVTRRIYTNIRHSVKNDDEHRPSDMSNVKLTHTSILPEPGTAKASTILITASSAKTSVPWIPGRPYNDTGGVVASSTLLMLLPVFHRPLSATLSFSAASLHSLLVPGMRCGRFT